MVRAFTLAAVSLSQTIVTDRDLGGPLFRELSEAFGEQKKPYNRIIQSGERIVSCNDWARRAKFVCLCSVPRLRGSTYCAGAG
jgi:hypothetical protein